MNLSLSAGKRMRQSAMDDMEWRSTSELFTSHDLNHGCRKCVIQELMLMKSKVDLDNLDFFNYPFVSITPIPNRQRPHVT